MVGEWRTNQITEIDTFDELKYDVVRNEDGVFYLNHNGEFHRDNGLPAVVWADGTEEYWINGHEQDD